MNFTILVSYKINEYPFNKNDVIKNYSTENNHCSIIKTQHAHKTILHTERKTFLHTPYTHAASVLASSSNWVAKVNVLPVVYKQRVRLKVSDSFIYAGEGLLSHCILAISGGVDVEVLEADREMEDASYNYIIIYVRAINPYFNLAISHSIQGIEHDIGKMLFGCGINH